MVTNDCSAHTRSDLGGMLRPAWLGGGTLTFHAGDIDADVARTASFVFVRDTTGRWCVTHVVARGWDIPGGHVEPGETALEAAVRELSEETGLNVDADQFSLLATGRIRSPGQYGASDGRYPDDAVLTFWMVTFGGIGPQLSATLECDTSQWVPNDVFAERCHDRTWWPLVALIT